MHPSRRRKKRPNYGIRTVEVMRGPNGFGFTISGQQPCILSCIVSNSPADQAGLRAGDFLISVNGVNVSKIAHDAVVGLIGTCAGPIQMTIAENYYSDSSDEELDCTRAANGRKPKYLHKPRPRHAYSKSKSSKDEDLNLSANNASKRLGGDDEEGGPIEYKALVGYLGTIEMPKQLLPNCRLQTVCSCIRKLRQEKRQPTAVLMTVLPTCLTLKNASNHILAIYPTNRVVYIGSSSDKDSRYFGLVTSAVCDGADSQPIEISNSCHVFVTDPKISDHGIHQKKAESFKINCTFDGAGNCLEFPRNSLYIVSLVQNMYKLQNNDKIDISAAPVANSPQPSASSNSDSGIGFRDDCGNISDRILVVEFPTQRPLLTVNNTSHRPVGITEMEALDLPSTSGSFYALNNVRADIPDKPNNLSKTNNDLQGYCDKLNNIRAFDISIANNISNNTIKNHLDLEKKADVNESINIKKNNEYLNNNLEINKLTCRAMPDPRISPNISDDDNNFDSCAGAACQMSNEESIKMSNEEPVKMSKESLHSVEFVDEDFKSSVDSLSVHSAKSADCKNAIFKVPFRPKKQLLKTVSSCDNLDKYHENIMNYKLSPKVYGLSKPNFSCEELNNLDGKSSGGAEKNYGYGSLQDLTSWNGQNDGKRKNIAQSEPDVRNPRNADGSGKKSCEQNGLTKSNNADGPVAWASSFEKLLEDPLGLHAFADFLKKEFSAENIYFWTACERYRRISSVSDRVQEAQRIYQQHLCVGAPEPVNVDAHARQCTEQCLPNPDSTIFDLAQKQIFNLMKFDSYPRFLKSDIYKQCLSGNLDASKTDAGLSLQIPLSSKLKKSLSNAEDRRRKSLLPWHKKNRSKSKDRGDDFVTKRKEKEVGGSSENICNRSDIHSSKSSLTSLDLAVNESSKSKIDDDSNRNALCRVHLNNGTTTVVQIKESETVQQLIARLLEKRGLTYSSYDVLTDKFPEAIDINESSTKLAGCEVNIEQKVVFKLDLPNRKIISVRSKYSKIIVDVIRSILHKYNYSLDQVSVTNNHVPVNLQLEVTAIDGARLNIQLIENTSVNNSVSKSKANKLDEITNQVFEGILQEKSESTLKPPKSDKGSVKSEDWGSEHSGFMGKFLRKDSGVHDRKKKSLITRIKPSSEDVPEQNHVKKPLIAKLKAGANKLQVGCSLESDELVEGLTRAQRCRLEDQRGTEINFELPDFLKDKENKKNETSKFYLGTSAASSQKADRVSSAKNLKLELHSNYENRSILLNNAATTTQSFPPPSSGLINKIYSSNLINPLKNSNNIPSSAAGKSAGEDSIKSSNSSLGSGLLEGAVAVESKVENSARCEPPPLPPKPKIVPIKPSNWNQDSFYKAKEKDSATATTPMYLEQPSSSFV